MAWSPLRIRPAGQSGPRGRAPVVVEKHAIADAAGVSRQELVVPDFLSRRKLFESLRIPESAGELILRGPADRRFEFVHSRRRVPAGGEDEKTDRQRDGYAAALHGHSVAATEWPGRIMRTGRQEIKRQRVASVRSPAYRDAGRAERHSRRDSVRPSPARTCRSTCPCNRILTFKTLTP